MSYIVKKIIAFYNLYYPLQDFKFRLSWCVATSDLKKAYRASNVIARLYKKACSQNFRKDSQYRY